MVSGHQRARKRTTTVVTATVVQRCPNTTSGHSLNDICILLVWSKKNQRWEFSGGTHEQGESHVGTLTRELSEELGLSVEDFEFLDHHEVGKPRHYRRLIKPTPRGRKLIFVTFRVQILTPAKIKIDRRELEDYKWVSISEIGDYKSNISENAWEVILELQNDRLLR